MDERTEHLVITVDDEAESKSAGAARDDRANWAPRVEQLRVEEVPAEALNLNVEGRQLAGPIQGFGRMWRKRHWVRLAGAEVEPAEVIRVWKQHFAEFWPAGNRFYGPITGLAPGEVAVINITMVPGTPKLSTGVMVLYADDESFTLMTPEGHVFAGWITFSSHVEEGVTVAQAEILMRASDPIFEVGMEIMGHRRENRFWEQTLANVAHRFGVTAVAETHVECMDRRYQWAQARNVWHNSAVRTGIYLGTAPVARIAGRLRGVRGRSPGSSSGRR